MIIAFHHANNKTVFSEERDSQCQHCSCCCGVLYAACGMWYAVCAERWGRGQSAAGHGTHDCVPRVPRSVWESLSATAGKVTAVTFGDNRDPA